MISSFGHVHKSVNSGNFLVAGGRDGLCDDTDLPPFANAGNESTDEDRGKSYQRSAACDSMMKCGPPPERFSRRWCIIECHA